MRLPIGKYKLKLLDIIIVFVFVSIAVSLFFLLFRTKKELIVIVKTYEDSIIWPGRHSSISTGDTNSTGDTISAVWFNNIFQPGMKEKDSLGKPMGEIISVRKYDNRPDSPTIYLTLKLKAVYSTGTKVYTYKGKNVLVGSTIQLYLDKVFVEALIVSTEGGEERFPLKKLSVSTQVLNKDPIFTDTTGVNQFIADNIKIGDTVKDSRGKIVLKIVEKRVEDANLIVKSSTGEVFLRKNPLLKDVYLTLDVMAYQIQDRYFFFDDIPILINNGIPIHLKKISIFPVVTGIEEVK